MRKITRDAVEAFYEGRNFKRSNTEVVVGKYVVDLFLFDNRIAYRLLDQPTNLQITNAGHSTATTKERLNGLRNVRIVQRRGVWYLNGYPWDGSWTNPAKHVRETY